MIASSAGELVAEASSNGIRFIGEFSKEHRRALDRAVRNGVLARDKGGPYPRLVTCYNAPGHDFAAERARLIEEMLRRRGAGASTPPAG
jgi:hypothetical protein